MEFNRKKISDTKEIDVAIRIENNQVTADDYFQRGEINFAKNDLEAALFDFTKALELNSSFAVAYFKRGLVYHFRNQLQSALNDYNKAILLNQNLEDVFYYRGSIYLGLNNYKAAIDDYTKVLQIKPNDFNTYFYRGLSHEKSNNINFALFDYSKAIELNPTIENAYFNRGKIYLSQNLLTNAEKDFNFLISLNNSKKVECDNLLQIYRKKQELEKQTKLNEKVRQEMLILINKSMQTANSFFSKKQYQQAVLNYTEVIKLNPSNAEAYFKRGQSYWHLNNKDNAIKDFDKATALDSTYGKQLLGLGIAGIAGNLINKFLKK